MRIFSTTLVSTILSVSIATLPFLSTSSSSSRTSPPAFIVRSLPTIHSRSSCPSIQSRVTTTKRKASKENSDINYDRIKKAGCGLSPIPSGNRLLFDPELEGKLHGTGTLNERIQSGVSYHYLPPTSARTNSTATTPPTATTASTVSSPPPNVEILPAQHFLEHLDEDLPLNFAKPTSPITATLLGKVRLITPDAPGDIQHLVFRLPPGMHYVEGQSISVIPPGHNPKSNSKKPHAPRLYSIASTRYGDLLDGNTVSLCVRRAEYYDPITGIPDPSKNGVCSNYLCDLVPNAQVQMAGPVGKTMLLPSVPGLYQTDVIMIATGTGIAPFRGFLHRLFMENTVARHLYNGMAWLVLGVPTTGGLLYQEEFEAMKMNAAPGQLRIDYAISREMTNPFDGGKMYVQHVIAQNADELFHRLDNGAHVYFCGLKGMMPPILDTLEQVSADRGVDWSSKLKELKAKDQWHVEVY